MTYLNAKKYIFSAPEAKLESDKNMLLLLEAMGNPHRHIKYLRLAGSNGKTVCAEMLTSVMCSASQAVGYIRMPLRDEPRENICIGQSCLNMDEFASFASSVRSISAELGISPTKAEIILCIALLAFKKRKCALYVIESDHFGEDPSRFLPAPFAVVICGTIPSKSIGEIDRIRSYIIKGIQEIVSAPQNIEAHKIISETCRSVNCRLSIPLRPAINIGKLSFMSTEFSYKEMQYKLGLCGKFQVYNAVLVLEVIDMLRRKGFDIPETAVAKGLLNVKIPAKFEVISLSPLMIADSTHTSVAIKAVCDSLADFKEITASNIRLCLPDEEMAQSYKEALISHGYTIEKIILSDGETKPKTLAKIALDSLGKDTVLLISGDYPFVVPIRYQILSSLSF